jgi:serine/threonine protein kinase
MELLDGQTLRSTIDGQTLPLRTVVDYAIQIGRGLAAAHERGIVHRDLKPDNIFVTRDGQLKILDFGLASAHARVEATAPTRAPATQAGTVMGTIGYMSPEQVRGERAGPPSDMFSFGCVLYEMVAGQRAFARDGDVETMHAILKDQPTTLQSIRRETPTSPAFPRRRRCHGTISGERRDTISLGTATPDPARAARLPPRSHCGGTRSDPACR